jgi:hypothetical protein
LGILHAVRARHHGDLPAHVSRGGVGVATAHQVLATARDELGTMESPPNSNCEKYARWYPMNGSPWCAVSRFRQDNGLRPVAVVGPTIWELLLKNE